MTTPRMEEPGTGAVSYLSSPIFRTDSLINNAITISAVGIRGSNVWQTTARRCWPTVVERSQPRLDERSWAIFMQSGGQEHRIRCVLRVDQWSASPFSAAGPVLVTGAAAALVEWSIFFPHRSHRPHPRVGLYDWPRVAAVNFPQHWPRRQCAREPTAPGPCKLGKCLLNGLIGCSAGFHSGFLVGRAALEVPGVPCRTT